MYDYLSSFAKNLADLNIQLEYLRKTAQKHAVFVKMISCTDRWFCAVVKPKDFFLTHSRAAFFKFYIPEPPFILSITFRTALLPIFHFLDRT